MRIVQAPGWYFPDSLGGTEIYVAALADRLRHAGHEVLIAAPDPGGTAERYQHGGIEVYRYPVARDVTRAEARAHVTTRGAERFHRWLHEMRPDIVHFHTFVTGLSLPEVEAAKAGGARVVVTTHAASLGFLCERGTLLYHGRELCDGRVEAVKCAACALQHRGVPSVAAGILARLPRSVAATATRLTSPAGTALGMRALIDSNAGLQRRLFEAASYVVVLSDWAAGVLRLNGAPPHKVIVNRLGIDNRRGQWQRKLSPAERPATIPITCGFAGRAETIKGLDDAVSAVMSLPRSVPVKLRAIVATSSTEELRFVERLRVVAASDPRITLEPAVSPEEIPALLAQFDVLLCPSKAVEGGPTVALEAHAVGTPVVGSAMPALTEYIEHFVNGALFPPGDWRTLATCLEQMVSDPAGTIDRWRTALRPPRTFDEIARDYTLLYARLLSDGEQHRGLPD